MMLCKGWRDEIKQRASLEVTMPFALWLAGVSSGDARKLACFYENLLAFDLDFKGG